MRSHPITHPTHPPPALHEAFSSSVVLYLLPSREPAVLQKLQGLFKLLIVLGSSSSRHNHPCLRSTEPRAHHQPPPKKNRGLLTLTRQSTARAAKIKNHEIVAKREPGSGPPGSLLIGGRSVGATGKWRHHVSPVCLGPTKLAYENRLASADPLSRDSVAPETFQG
ncbi:hypothetical protein BHM03_00000984 [Ensete ventricosum]|nr:hypothetical protein BHM03_00000984 [Ensete ventricosum]